MSKSVNKLWESPEYKTNFVKKVRGKPSNRKGVKLSDAIKEKIRQANLGEKNPNYGKPRSQSFLDKMEKTYDGVVSPDGVVYTPLVGLRAFCREHNLDSGGMSKLLNGKQSSHKGWTKYVKE